MSKNRDDAREHQPGSALNRALAQREAGDLQGAIETLVAAVSDNLEDAELAVTLAKILHDSGQSARAEPWFRHAMKLAPDDVVVRMSYGTFLGSQGLVDEAYELLAEARREAQVLRALAAEGVPTPVGDAEGFLAATEINLATAALERGDHTEARQLVAPWLSNYEYWGAAHGILAEIVERDDLDPRQLAEDGLSTGEVSPFMVCHLLEVALDADPCDLAMLERVIARADACFPFDWRNEAPEIQAALAAARQALGQAVMRAEADPDAYPHVRASRTLRDDD